MVVLWHLWERKSLAVGDGDGMKVENVSKGEREVYKSSAKKEYVNTIRYGQRPDFKGNYM